MITVILQYSFEGAKYLFESAGLEVKLMSSREFYKKETIPNSNIWVVVNPHTNVAENLSLAFIRCVSKRQDSLTSDIGKAEIYNSFEKK